MYPPDASGGYNYAAEKDYLWEVFIDPSLTHGGGWGGGGGGCVKYTHTYTHIYFKMFNSQCGFMILFLLVIIQYLSPQKLILAKLAFYVNSQA